MIRLETEKSIWALSMAFRDLNHTRREWQTDSAWETAQRAALFVQLGYPFDHASGSYLVDYERLCEVCDAGEYYAAYMSQLDPDKDFNFSYIRIALK